MAPAERRVSAAARCRWAAAALSLAGALLSRPGPARAHQLDSASLSLVETASARFMVRWQASSRTLEDDVRAAVVFPAGCHLTSAVELACGPAGLVGNIAFPWIQGTTTRVVVDIQWRGGTHLLRVVSPSAPTLRVYGAAGAGWRALLPLVADYIRLGVEHIATGFDHLFFVVALALLVRGGARLLATVTAFTLAHSASLAATVLGLWQAPSAPVEASIALSVVLVCAECLRPAATFAQRAPWAVAFAFGLLHGLGFASALLELGVPERHVPAALVSFNIGVEIGQLVIVALVLGLRRLAARLELERPQAHRALIYSMGSIAAFWSIERAAAVFGR